MRITWRDAITTLSAGGAIAVERAYFENFDWPLVSSMNWVLAGIGVLGLVAILAGMSFDKYAGSAWAYIAALWAFVTVAISGLGMYYEVTDYVVASMLNVIAVWIVASGYHLVEHTTPRGTQPQAV